VTLQQVALAKQALEDEGRRPSANAILERLGGSKRDIVRYLRELNGEIESPSPPQTPASGGELARLRQECWRLRLAAAGLPPTSAEAQALALVRSQFERQRAVALAALQQARRLRPVVELLEPCAYALATGQADAALVASRFSAGQSPQRAIYQAALATVQAWCGPEAAAALVATPRGDPGWSL
jgi:Plasmid replication region DNA-binding N-term